MRNGPHFSEAGPSSARLPSECQWVKLMAHHQLVGINGTGKISCLSCQNGGWPTSDRWEADGLQSPVRRALLSATIGGSPTKCNKLPLLLHSLVFHT